MESVENLDIFAENAPIKRHTVASCSRIFETYYFQYLLRRNSKRLFNFRNFRGKESKTVKNLWFHHTIGVEIQYTSYDYNKYRTVNEQTGFLSLIEAKNKKY